MNAIIKKAAYLATAWIPTNLICTSMYGLLRLRGEYSSNPQKELTSLMQLDNRLYGLQGMLSIRYGDGIHSKHKHTKYHDFFITQIQDGQEVLEIGCGYGALANSIASTRKVNYTAIDIVEKNILKAQKRFKRDNLHFIYGDATQYTFDASFDAVVMSNVLEHIEDRVGILKMIKEHIRPTKIIIRVPLYERDWRVPLKEELGIEHRLDPTHYTEYTLDSYQEEIQAAGLHIDHLEVRWGEIWSIVSEKSTHVET